MAIVVIVALFPLLSHAALIACSIKASSSLLATATLQATAVKEGTGAATLLATARLFAAASQPTISKVVTYDVLINSSLKYDVSV